MELLAPRRWQESVLPANGFPAATFGENNVSGLGPLPDGLSKASRGDEFRI